MNEHSVFSLRNASAVAIGVAAGAFCTNFLVGCGDDVSDSTSQQRVALTTTIEVANDVSRAFTNGYGWSVHLDEALIAVGPFYYFEGEPVLTQRTEPPKSLWASVYDWLIPDAEAHPGHYQSGNALGQMLESKSIDLSSTPAPLPDGDGVTGTYRSASFFFAKPKGSGPVDSKLEGATARFHGLAAKDSKQVTFHVSIRLDELLNYEQKPSVIGCAFVPYADVSGDSQVTITLDPTLWFDQVDFDEVAEADESDVDLADGTIARKALIRGLMKGAGYVFSAEPQQH